MWKDRERSMGAGGSGCGRPVFDTLLVTVDVPVAGARLRDTRNGMSIPPALTLAYRAGRGTAPPAGGSTC